MAGGIHDADGGLHPSTLRLGLTLLQALCHPYEGQR
jgi:hypothetical protein